jgi:hypothetical protein
MTPEMLRHLQTNAAGQPAPTPFPSSAPQPAYAPSLPPGYVPPTPEQIAAWQASQAPVQTSPIPAVAQASAPEQPYGQPVPVALPAVAPAATELVQAFDDAAPPAPVEQPKASTTRKGRPPKTATAEANRCALLCSCASAGMAPDQAKWYLELLENGGAA